MVNRSESRGGRFSFGGFLLTLLLGAVVGSIFTFFALQHRERSTVGPPSDSESEPGELRDARRSVEAYIDRKLREWDLDPDQLKAELERGGEIVRKKGREIGSRIPGELSDVKIIARIKARYTLDRELSGWDIIVGCDDGHVTLSGTVQSAEQIGRAVVIALDVEGVVDVVSSLKVR